MELNEKIWLAEAEKLTDNTAAWMSGAQSMLTSVEKMLKEKVKSNQHSLNTMPPVYESTVDHLNTRIEAFKELLHELKSIQP